MKPDSVYFEGIVESFQAYITEIEAYQKLFGTLEKFELEQTGQSQIKSLAPPFCAGDYEVAKTG